MAKKGGWVPMDKNLVNYLPKNKPYSIVEAAFSYTLDHDNNNNNSVSGYSKLWSWSRSRVRNFIEILKTGRGHLKDSQGTVKGHSISLIDKALWDSKDRPRTGKGHSKDRQPYSTIILNPNPNPNPKKEQEQKHKPIRHKFGEFKHVLLTQNEYEKLEKDFNGELSGMIKNMDESIQQYGNKYKIKDFNLTLRKWNADKKGKADGKSIDQQARELLSSIKSPAN